MSKKFWSLKKSKSPAIKVDKDEVKKRLTPLQFRVTQEAMTERPFSGEYLKLKDNGMYACVVCDQDLFSSQCKYESGCGWPAFFQSEDDNKLIFRPDLSHVGGNILLLAIKPDLVRTEVTCGHCGAHLGHLFDDGPKPTGKRYCINSAALTFKKSQSMSNMPSTANSSTQTEAEVEEKTEVGVRESKVSIRSSSTPRNGQLRTSYDEARDKRTSAILTDKYKFLSDLPASHDVSSSSSSSRMRFFLRGRSQEKESSSSQPSASRISSTSLSSQRLGGERIVR